MFLIVANDIRGSKALFFEFDNARNIVFAETQAQANLFEVAERKIKCVGFQIAGEKFANGLRSNIFRDVCGQTDRLFCEEAHHISSAFASEGDAVVLRSAHADIVVFVVADAPVLRCLTFDVLSVVILIHFSKMRRISCSEFLRIADSPGNQIGTLAREMQLVDDEFFVSDRAEECIADAGSLTVDCALSLQDLEGVGFCDEDIEELGFLVLKKQNGFSCCLT